MMSVIITQNHCFNFGCKERKAKYVHPSFFHGRKILDTFSLRCRYSEFINFNFSILFSQRKAGGHNEHK